MPDRTAPYPAYNYIVDLKGPRNAQQLLGGFSDVSGLNTEIHVSDYRDGNEVNPHVRKVPGSHTVGKVTLKRGVVNSKDLWDWITQTQKQGVLGQRDVTITMLDESRAPVQIYKLTNVVPSKYTGPTLAGKGGGEVAMEELELTPEGIAVMPAS
ncbi:MAG TPA: phage tail protein [Candidatus Dormibacteraeota bacterium]|nr:phage tail protein [Candidatus Dormibacteraeota bacterium]